MTEKLRKKFGVRFFFFTPQSLRAFFLYRLSTYSRLSRVKFRINYAAEETGGAKNNLNKNKSLIPEILSIYYGPSPNSNKYYSDMRK